jgi:hypothetical protein
MLLLIIYSKAISILNFHPNSYSAWILVLGIEPDIYKIFLGFLSKIFLQASLGVKQ